MRRSDIISGGLLVVFSLAMIFVVVPYQIRSSSELGLDPKFFPVTLLWLLLAMGVLLVATRIGAPADLEDAEPVIGPRNWLYIVCAAAFFAVTFVAINFLGFLAAGMLMIATLMAILGLRQLHWLELIGVSVGAPFFIYYALYKIFSVQLPSGVLFP